MITCTKPLVGVLLVEGAGLFAPLIELLQGPRTAAATPAISCL